MGKSLLYPYHVISSSLIVSRIHAEAGVIERTCDSLRSLPPVNCEYPDVELTSETCY
jgi:hypothetical protein